MHVFNRFDISVESIAFHFLLDLHWFVQTVFCCPLLALTGHWMLHSHDGWHLVMWPYLDCRVVSMCLLHCITSFLFILTISSCVHISLALITFFSYKLKLLKLNYQTNHITNCDIFLTPFPFHETLWYNDTNQSHIHHEQPPYIKAFFSLSGPHVELKQHISLQWVEV